MAAVSLYEASQVAESRGEFLRAGVMATFGRSAPLLAAMPIESITGAAYVWRREVSLGTNAFRAVNASFTPDNGQTETRSVPLKIIGGEVDVDTFILDTMGMDQLPQKVERKLADMAQRVTYNFIKGSVTTAGGATAAPNGFDGLQVRYGGGFSTTAVVDAGENAGQILQNSGGSSALSMRDLDIAIQACENPTHLLMAKKQLLNITGFLRGSSAVQQTKDDFGRILTTYNGLPMIEADKLGTVSGLEALGYNENNDSTTSLYVLSMGDEGYHLVQNSRGMIVTNLGEQQDTPAHRTRVQWYATPVDPHPRCVVRLYKIADLVAVA
jgi:hypothetical protein